MIDRNLKELVDAAAKYVSTVDKSKLDDITAEGLFTVLEGISLLEKISARNRQHDEVFEIARRDLHATIDSSCADALREIHAQAADVHLHLTAFAIWQVLLEEDPADQIELLELSLYC